ncbi:precorrin-6A reductase [uncultured Agathobaculum sp.]|uniref:precorrin-6A reductase n=1 Tax=uncultured Agathobaculum sp. TaxID=2048140 RepID=UPI00296FE94E
MKMMIFSGTTEGHELCRFLSKNSVQAEVFVATEYGATVMEPMDGITIHEGRLDEKEIAERLTSDTLLIDATHPYAAAVTDNLRAACAEAGARYERLLRPALPFENCEIVLDTAAAVDWLNAHPGRVLLTTGSKELEAYTAVQDYRERVFPRVLPTASVLEKCSVLGFPGAHIIAMQGPFSQAMNAALLREIGADILVTKDTGASGGFAEKVAAAKEISAKVLVIARPREEQGRNQAKMQEFLTDLLGLQPKKVQRKFTIIGAGMGAMDTLTGEAVRALETAEAVFATKRLAALSPKAKVCAFSELAEQAIQCTEKHILLLVSGDVGFFSAAGKLRERLLPHGKVQLVPGLSSMQYMCAKCGISYENLCFKSLHGRSRSILGAVSYHEATFALTGGENNAQTVCKCLTEAGLGDLPVHLGENLGAENERVLHSTAAELAELSCADLAVLLVENPCAVNKNEPIRDEMLTRAKVPMTKEEVRWVSVNRLAVRPSDTVWDIGAGTGAVTLELARKAYDGTVYAVEYKSEAAVLLHGNRTKLGGYNVNIIEGHAPEVLENLPAPDCVFVGGSGGELREILALAKAKNPAVRVVVNAIALETLFAAQSALQELGFNDIQITQLAATRGRSVGAYTMLTANNPVFILSGRSINEGK